MLLLANTAAPSTAAATKAQTGNAFDKSSRCCSSTFMTATKEDHYDPGDYDHGDRGADAATICKSVEAFVCASSRERNEWWPSQLIRKEALDILFVSLGFLSVQAIAFFYPHRGYFFQTFTTSLQAEDAASASESLNFGWTDPKVDLWSKKRRHGSCCRI